MIKILLLLATHAVVAALGFGAGIYVLPILTAPPAPAESEINAITSESMFSGMFRRDLDGSDMFHWGEGTISVSEKAISFRGKLAPGPDYKLYLSPQFVQNETEFLQLKSKMVRVGEVKTFENFVVSIPAPIDPSQFNTAIVWCESFGEFISSASYR